MKTTKRILSSILAIIMVFSVMSVGFTATAVESDGATLKEIVLEPIARPDVSFSCTPVTRVAAAVNSLEPGTTIVKATPSGVPELSGAYAAQAYAGETPAATKISFQARTVGVTPGAIKCSNDSIVLSAMAYDGATGTYNCEIVSGTAAAGEAITFTIDYQWTDGNSYQAKCVTYVEGIANGGSYAEAQSEIQALSGIGSYYRVYASASTRLLGRGVYYEQPAEIITNGEDPYRSYGIYNVATGTATENVSSGYNTSLYRDDKTDKPAGKHNQALEFFVPGTTLAHVYVDKSEAATLEDINLRLDANVGALSDRNNPNPYTALADAWVSTGSNANNEAAATTNDPSAENAIGLVIPPKANYGVTQFSENAAMNTITGGVGQYQNLFTGYLSGIVANLVDGSSYTITTKYYAYMWNKTGLLQHYNMTSSPTVPTSITFHIVDKGELREMIDYVMNSEPELPTTRATKKGANPQGWYYQTGFSQFQNAYVEALRMLNNPQAPQTDIDGATRQLRTMYNNLKLKTADYSRVNDLNDIADEILDNEDCYPESAIELIEEAQDMVEKSYTILFQDAVDTMADNLQTAIDNAIPLDADYSDVEDAKLKAEALNKDDYTDASWDALEDAIDAVVYGKTALEQDEVDAMAEAIEDAIANLEEITADFTALKAKLAEAKAIDKSLYTNPSVLNAPIANAENAVADHTVNPWDEIRQPEVDALVTALDNAIKALALKAADKTALKAAIDADIPGVIEYYDQAILAQYDALVAEGIAMYNNDALTILDQSKIDAKTAAIKAKYAELMASYDDSCRHKVLEDAVIENEVAPDCVNNGSYDTVIYCADCGVEVSRVTTTVPALGHTDGEAVVEKEVDPDCVNDGSYDTVVYCTVCGEEVSRKTTVIPALGHTEGEAVIEDESDADCVNDGAYDTVVYCTVCGEEVSRETTIVDALGHTEGEEVIENEVAADCVNDGSYDTVVYCTVCGEEVSRETTVVDALGHTEGEEVIENEVAADCVNEGSYDTVIYCTVCDAEVSRVTTTVDALGHTEGEAVEENIVDATYTADGSYDSVVYCTVCGEELSRETIVIPMLEGFFDVQEGSTTVIDRDAMYIYGLEIGIMDIEDYVDYSASVTYEAPDGFGTGTTVTTYRSGEEWETFTVVIFGDLTGDGVVDIYDSATLAALVNGDIEIDVESATYFAADLNGDTVADIYDLAIINAVVNGEIEISQVPAI